MKKEIKKFLAIFLSFVIIFSFSGAQTALASSYLSQAPLNQVIEILQQEIAVLQSLIKNSSLQQNITAGSYIAVDLSNNLVLLSKNINQTYSMASITKLMNAVIAKENINMSQSTILTENMMNPLGQSPCIFAGLNITAQNLLQVALIQSSNDAAESLSYFVGKEKYLDFMNQKAKDLGMQNTVYYDTNGLNSANKSTTQDLAKLLAYVYKNHPEILEITKNNDFWLPDQNGFYLKFQNVNNFYPLSYFVGGKTGYTPEAKQAMASVFNVNGRPVSIAVLYSANRQADIFNILNQIK